MFQVGKKRYFFISLGLCLVLFILKGYSSLSSEDNYEGWVWRCSLNFTLAENIKQFIDADSIHQEMADLAKKLDQDLLNEKNIALLRLGLILEDENGCQTYTLTPCFDDYIFYSGQKIVGSTDAKIFRSQDQILQGVQLQNATTLKKYIINEPKNYNSSLERIHCRLTTVFPDTDKERSIIGNKKYTDQNMAHEIKQTLDQGRTESSLREIEKIIGGFEGKLSHSEQKIIFYIEDSLKDLPFYWSLKIPSLLEKFLTEKENHYQSKFSDRLLEIEKKSIIDEFKTISLDKLDENFRNTINGLSGRLEKITPKKPKEAKQPADFSSEIITFLGEIIKHLKIEDEELKGLFQQISQKTEPKKVSSKGKTTRQFKNPPEPVKAEKEELKDSNEFLKPLKEALNLVKSYSDDKESAKNLEIDQYLTRIDNLSDENKSESWQTDIKYLREKILARQESFALWIRALEIFIGRIPEGTTIKGIVLHLHSWRDICNSCGPTLARECERKGGFVDHLKSICSASQNPTPEASLPFLRILASCSEFRPLGGKDERETIHSDEFSEDANYLIPINPSDTKGALFYQYRILEGKGTTKNK